MACSNANREDNCTVAARGGRGPGLSGKSRHTRRPTKHAARAPCSAQTTRPEGESIPALIEQLVRRDDHFVGQPGKALGRIGLDAVAPLAGVVGHEKPSARCQVALALGEVFWQAKRRAAGRTDDPRFGRIVDLLLVLLADKEEKVCWRSAKALERVTPFAADQVVPALLKRIPYLVRPNEIQSYVLATAASKYGQDAAPAVRKEAAETLIKEYVASVEKEAKKKKAKKKKARR